MSLAAFVATPRKYGLLVADDEGEVRDALNDGLQREGFSVWLAADGQEALDLYRDHCATIDVVLLDVRMPGLDGPQTLAALQEITPQVRCCFMSGYLGRYTAEKLRALGAATVFAKPFQLAEVAHVLGELANRPGVDWERGAEEESGAV
jgi:CheY-like chemotaxis protein